MFLQLSEEIMYFLWVSKGGDGEDEFLQLSDEMMYTPFLWVDKGGETVRTCFCSYPMRSCTSHQSSSSSSLSICGWAKAEKR